MLRELELHAVVRLYGLQEADVPVAANPGVPAIAAVSATKARWIFVGATADEAQARLLDAMMAAVGCKRGDDVALDAAADAKVIVALGEAAARGVLGMEADLASLRGVVHRRGPVPVVVTEHPATLLAAPAAKARAWEDLVLARRTASGT